MIYLCSIYDIYKSFKIVLNWTEIVSQNFCDTQCTSGWEFLQHPVYEWLQNFCHTQCMNSWRISATFSVWMVAEFLLHPVYEWLQNFCDIQCMSGRRISATSSDWLFADYIDYDLVLRRLFLVNETYQNLPRTTSEVELLPRYNQPL